MAIEEVNDQGKLDQEIAGLGLNEKVSLHEKRIFIVKNNNDTVAILVFKKNAKKMSLVILVNFIKYPEANVEISEAIKKAVETLFSENPDLLKISSKVKTEQAKLIKILSLAGLPRIQDWAECEMKRPDDKTNCQKDAKDGSPKPEIKKTEIPIQEKIPEPAKRLFGQNKSLLKIAQKIQPEPLKINGSQINQEIKPTAVATPETEPPKMEMVQPPEPPVTTHVKTEPLTPKKKEVIYPIIVEIKNLNPKKTVNDLTANEETFFAKNQTRIKDLAEIIFKSIEFNGIHNPLKINFDELLKVYDIGKENNKIWLMAVVGKKINRLHLGQKQIEKIILSESSMEIFFEQAAGSAIINNTVTQPAVQTFRAVSPVDEQIQGGQEKQTKVWIEKISEEEKLTSVQKMILKMASLGSLKTSDVRRIKGTEKDIIKLKNKNLIILKNNRYELILPKNLSQFKKEGNN